MSKWLGLQRLTAPVAAPVTLAEAKQQCRIEHDDEDTLLQRVIAAATELIDGPEGLGVALMPQTWQKVMAGFPCEIILPLQPVTAILGIDYIDTAGALQVVPPLSYRLFTAGPDAVVEMVTGAAWPVADHRRAAVFARFSCGHATAAAVPAALRHAILLMVGTLYEYREGEMAGNGANSHVMAAFERLKAQHRRVSFG